MISYVCRRFGKALLLCASLCAVSPLHAGTMYNISNFGFAPTSYTTIFGPSGEIFQVTYLATNSTSFTLTNLYVLSGRAFINGTEATLTGPGSYQLSDATLNTQATDANVFITPSQTNALFDAASVGSTTSPQIPGFFVTASLAPFQSASFIVDFQAPPAVANVRFDGIPVSAVAATPEPSDLLLLVTGFAAVAGMLRLRAFDVVRQQR